MKIINNLKDINLNNIDKIGLYELAEHYNWKYNNGYKITYKYGFVDCGNGVFSMKYNLETLSFIKYFKFDYWIGKDGSLYFNKFKVGII